MRRHAFLLVLVLAPAVFAQRPPASEYEKWLLPAYGETSGANGARWSTALWMRNESDEPLDAFPLAPTCFTSSLCFLSMRPYPAFQPRMTGHYELPYVGFIGPSSIGVRSTTGVFLYVERARAQRLTAQLRIADTSRSVVRWTALPVVRESEFFTGSQSILGVPILRSGRIGLRIYDLDSRPSAEFLIRFFDVLPVRKPGSIDTHIHQFGETRLTTSHDAATDHCEFFYGCPAVPYRPGFGQTANLLDAVPRLRDAEDRPHGVRMEIVPLTDGARYWPIVTITDDQTNVVSVFTVW